MKNEEDGNIHTTAVRAKYSDHVEYIERRIRKTFLKFISTRKRKVESAKG
jgi:hypothetical protein